ncbi:hypothetical protein IAU60_006402 [Kwoniella sp. DSM 27419]
MTVPKPGHLVVLPSPMWGHLRPLLHLVVNLITLHPRLHLSLLVTHSAGKRINKELQGASFVHIHEARADSAETIADRIQVIPCYTKEYNTEAEWHAQSIGIEGMDYAKSLFGFLSMVFNKDAGIEGVVNKFEAITPGLVIFDLFHTFVPGIVRGVMSAHGHSMPPLIAFIPNNASAAWHTMAKPKDGGHFGWACEASAADVAKGRDPREAWVEHTFESFGKVKPLPGLPTKYDYEWWPLLATLPAQPEMCMAIAPSHYTFWDEAVTGLICPTTAEAEAEAVAALEQGWGRKVYMVGPQFPDSVWLGQPAERVSRSADDDKVFNFLEKSYKKYGAKSVTYVSFGSLWFPATRPELVRFILNSLKEAGAPFIFAFASDVVPPPLDLIEEFKDDETNCMVRFAPQWDVLQHPATGYFLSHCGSNSTAEAILSELPLVAMPFAADQGEFTAWLTEVYHVGIDLKQVKTFKNPDWNKLYDGTTVVGTEEAIMAELKETWGRMRSQEGEDMRERMKGLKSVLTKSWKEGRARKDMLALGDMC